MTALFWLAAMPTAADPVYCPDTGNSYDFVSGLMDWQEALAVAGGLEYQGVPGHLATVSTLTENQFIAETFASGQAEFFAWLGGYEPDDDGIWVWGAGPENGIQFSDDNTPSPPFFFANWGGLEPNDHAEGEDYLAINLGNEFANVEPGEWIDSPNPNPSDPILGLIVEFEDVSSAVQSDDGTPAASGVRLDFAPNPFNPITTISFELPVAGPVQLSVFDMQGRRLRLLADETLTAGAHEIMWDGRDDAGRKAPSGTFFCRLDAGDVQITGKLILVQ